jgi:hypothetical protein
MMEKWLMEQQIFIEGDSRVYMVESHRQVEAHQEVDQED